MKKIFTLCLIATLGNVYAQNFYDLNQIQEIKIYFGFSNWDYRLDTAKAGADDYVLADSVRVNGTLFLNCGVKFKGNSSYDVNRAKNPLHVKLDYSQNADYQGYEDIKLGNGWSDNSMLREPLCYSILRQYMDAPQGNFAKVYINGAYYGLMNNAESIDSKFLRAHFYSSNRVFVKCNPESIGTGLGNGPNLEYLGTTVSDYSSKYELKSDTGWTDLIHLCDTLNNTYSAFNSMADVDRFLWMLAFNNATVNLDSYTGAFRQNYYLYRNHANQWIPIVWDLNMCLGGFSSAGGTAGSLTPTTMRTMSPTLHKTESGWPLIYKLLNDPFFEKMYLAHLRTINNENFAGAQYKTLTNTLHSLIDAEIPLDPNFLSTYTDFQNSLTTNTNGSNGAGTSPGVYLLMDNRAAYLSNVLSAAPPVISNINTAGTNSFGSTITITATVTNGTSVYLGYRYSRADRFVRVAMFDDGAHGDGASGDNVFGASIALNSLNIQYYIYSENSNTGAFSPERAEHEFYSIQASIQQAGANDVVLNELTTANTTGLENEAGKHKDWIEILNKTNQPLGLSNLYLSNVNTDLTKWRFPTDAFIGAGEHLLIWADDLDTSYLDLHTNFNLNNLGESLFLSDGTTIIDNVTFGTQTANYAMGRCADGVGSFVSLSVRTPRATNDCSIDVATIATTQFNVYPNPTDGTLFIELPTGIQNSTVFDAYGRVVFQNTSNNTLIDISSLPKGFYTLRVQDDKNDLYVRGVVKL